MAKKKRDLKRELAKKRFKKPNPFFYFLYYAIGKSFFLGAKYHPHYEIVDKIEDGPAFLIWNHQSRRDHTFLCRAAWPRRISIVCEYNEFFRSHLAGVFKCIDILPKKPYCNNDLLGLKAISSIIKQGGVVALSPEGTSSIFGDNQPIAPGTAKFIKHFKVPVYCVDLKGSYLTNNKICEDDRPGQVFVKLYKLFTPEDLERMTPEEIDAKINEAFHHDDYLWNKKMRIKFKSKGRICTNLQDILYRCPRCGSELHMNAEGDHIECTECGNGAKMNDYYDFIPYDDTCVIPETPSLWVKEERRQIIKDIRADENYSFVEEVEIAELPSDHYLKNHLTGEVCGKGVVTIDHQGFHFRGKKHGEPWNYDIPYKLIWTFNICVDMTMFALYVNDEYCEFHPKRRSVAKMMMLVEEMHRLHVGIWKNFPWNDDLYE